MPPGTRRSNNIVRKVTARQPIPKDVLVELTPRHNKECMFCGHKDISEKKYGPLYQLNDVIVHYFCILLSSRAIQNGSDKEGIWGFLLKDIKAELKRGTRETCYYCKKIGATIACCNTKCRKVFHLPCGLKNGSMHQYFQTFKSFCQLHRISQSVELSEIQVTNSVQCAICKENVISSPLPTTIWAPCCKRDAWFHRDCIQNLALSAGYFFKCPLCNNIEKFKLRMLTLGIYIPSRKHCYLKKLNRRDASWETVPNAYAELLERPRTCSATCCMCPHENKREHQEESGQWEIVLCYTCGSIGTHLLCSSLKCDQQWLCNSCQRVLSEDAASNPKKRKIESSGASTSQQATASTSRLINRPAIASTSGLTNGHSGLLNRPAIASTSGLTNGHCNLTNRSAIASTSGLTNGHTCELASRSSNRRSNARDTLRTTGTRESVRLINNNRETRLKSQPSTSAMPQPIINSDAIVISDESDSDDDVQCITYIDPPKIPRILRTCEPGMPVIDSVTSMSTSVTPITNHFANGFLRTHNPMRNFTYVSQSIDLTLDDD